MSVEGWCYCFLKKHTIVQSHTNTFLTWYFRSVDKSVYHTVEFNFMRKWFAHTCEDTCEGPHRPSLCDLSQGWQVRDGCVVRSAYILSSLTTQAPFFCGVASVLWDKSTFARISCKLLMYKAIEYTVEENNSQFFISHWCLSWESIDASAAGSEKTVILCSDPCVLMDSYSLLVSKSWNLEKMELKWCWLCVCWRGGHWYP